MEVEIEEQICLPNLNLTMRCTQVDSEEHRNLFWSRWGIFSLLFRKTCIASQMQKQELSHHTLIRIWSNSVVHVQEENTIDLPVF
jgi:hypothetical protein